MSTSEGPTTSADDDPYRRTEPHGSPPPASYAGSSAQEPRTQDPYGQELYPAAGPAPRNGLGVAALVVGIVSLLVGIVPFVGLLGVVGLVAVVLGVIALSRVRRGLATNRGVSITGIVLGALAVLAAVAWLVVIIVLVNSSAGQSLGETITRCSQVPQSQQQACVEDGLGLQR